MKNKRFIHCKSFKNAETFYGVLYFLYFLIFNIYLINFLFFQLQKNYSIL